MWPVKLKHLLFRNAGGVSTLLVLAATGVPWALGKSWQTTITAVGAALPLVYFMQKQKLEELRLFKDLFTEFNRRYDAMNDQLAPIRKNTEGPLIDTERQALFDYFNLCGEEFLFYRLGYIDPAAWDAWHNGMKGYLENPRIERLWREEIRSDSYYRLDI